MKRKIKIIYNVAKKAVKKTKDLGAKDFYKGKSAPEAAVAAVTHVFKYGPRATISKAKREMVRVGGVNTVKHIFPNGLVSGVQTQHIGAWYEHHGKKVTIVIPSYNDYDLLKVCVDSIYATCPRKDLYNIIIVDDYCQEENRLKLKSLENDVTSIIFREENGGFAKAVNTGLRAVPKGNDAILLNSDIEAHKEWLEALQYGAYVFGEKVGIVGPKLLYPDGRIQSAGSYRNTEAREWFDHYYRFQPSNYGPANVPQYVQSTTGACMYIKNSVMDKVGILDEGFAFAFEDADWCLRAWEAGYRTLYFPAAVLTHHESATRAKNKNISERERISVTYFWKKWGDWFDKRNVRNADGKIRIIYVLQTIGRSGGIKIVIEHANRLSKLGYDVEIWSLDDKPVWPIQVKTRSFKNYKQLIAALEPEEAIKVATWWETAHPVWMASVLKGIATYFIQENESWFYPDDPDAQRVVISCYRKEFKNLTTSSYNLDEIRSFGLNASMVPCGYDDTTYNVLPNMERKDNVLIALGRTFFQKNFLFSFNAWKKMGESRPDFWLYGSEPDMKSLDKRITYFDNPPDKKVNTLFNQSTVFIQTSRHEGFCIPVLEAMATGTPVICTDMHGNRDFCFDGKNCLMVEQDNEVELTRALERLFKDKKLQEKLRKEGLKTAKQYQWDAVIKKLADFYETTAAGDPIEDYVLQKYSGKVK